MLSTKTRNKMSYKTDLKMIADHWYAVFLSCHEDQPIRQRYFGRINRSRVSAYVTALHAAKRSCHLEPDKLLINSLIVMFDIKCKSGPVLEYAWVVSLLNKLVLIIWKRGSWLLAIPDGKLCDFSRKYGHKLYLLKNVTRSTKLVRLNCKCRGYFPNR